VDQRREGPLLHLFGDDPGGIVFGIAGVDDQRQAGFARDGDVRAEQACCTARSEWS
jgi:hypothetical protein